MYRTWKSRKTNLDVINTFYVQCLSINRCRFQVQCGRPVDVQNWIPCDGYFGRLENVLKDNY